MAILLKNKNKDFKYEANEAGKFDFCFENIALEIKSMNEKEYEKKEKEKLGKAEPKHVPGVGALRKTDIAYQGSVVRLQEKDYGDGMIARNREEDGNGVFESDFSQKRNLLNYLADFQNKKIGKFKKVMLFFAQDFTISGASWIHIDDIACWYFGYHSAKDDKTTQEDYAKEFKLTKGKEKGKIIKKDGSIKAFLFLGNPGRGNVLTWANNFSKEKSKIKIWTNNVELDKHLQSCF